jgi:hypothetical protein
MRNKSVHELIELHNKKKEREKKQTALVIHPKRFIKPGGIMYMIYPLVCYKY